MLIIRGLLAPKCNSDLVYRFEEFIGRNDFDRCKKIISRCIRTKYNINVMHQAAYLVIICCPLELLGGLGSLRLLDNNMQNTVTQTCNFALRMLEHLSLMELIA